MRRVLIAIAFAAGAYGSGVFANQLGALAPNADAAAILVRAQTALGGSRAFGRVQALTVKGKRFRSAKSIDPISFTLGWPDRYRSDDMNIVSHVLAGARFWQIPSQNDDARQIAEGQMRIGLVTNALTFLLRVPNAFSDGVMLTRTSLAWNGRQVPAIQAKHGERLLVTLAFDPETGLPLGTSQQRRRLGADGTEQPFTTNTSFSDYKAVNGVKFPHRFDELEGSKVYSIIEDITVNGPVDPLFVQPVK